jgi:hypothetical protein
VKLLEQKVPVTARFDGSSVRPLEFVWQGQQRETSLRLLAFFKL